MCSKSPGFGVKPCGGWRSQQAWTGAPLLSAGHLEGCRGAYVIVRSRLGVQQGSLANMEAILWSRGLERHAQSRGGRDEVGGLVKA
jgi:hypothetical protein